MILFDIVIIICIIIYIDCFEKSDNFYCLCCCYFFKCFIYLINWF